MTYGLEVRCSIQLSYRHKNVDSKRYRILRPLPERTVRDGVLPFLFFDLRGLPTFIMLLTCFDCDELLIAMYRSFFL